MRRMLFLLGLLALCALAHSARAAAPVIFQHPASQTTTVGQPVTFMSSASGTGALFYQWQRGTLNIPNATNRNFFIPSAQLSDDGTLDTGFLNVLPGACTRERCARNMSSAMSNNMMPPAI